jgi:uncharacterized protein (TIGR00106 family)
MIVNGIIVVWHIYFRWCYVSMRNLFRKRPQSQEGWKMIAQFKVVPIGKGESLSSYVAECVKIVQKSGLKYQLTPMATILEGEWDEVMGVVGECHRKVRSLSRRVVTTIEIDDREGRSDAMEQKIRSVQDKLTTR